MAEKKKNVIRSDQEYFLIKTMVIDKLSFKKFGFDTLDKSFAGKWRREFPVKVRGTSRD